MTTATFKVTRKDPHKNFIKYLHSQKIPFRSAGYSIGYKLYFIVEAPLFTLEQIASATKTTFISHKDREHRSRVRATNNQNVYGEMCEEV